MDKITYNYKDTNEKYDFIWNNFDNPYLVQLREEFKLEKIVEKCNSDFDKAKEITNWVHNLWKHDGYNEPIKNDPISILREVSEGKRFRCVEYGIVISGCLNALGIHARELALKTEDVETREFGAGHVVLEAYIEDYKKWVFIDGQFNLIPVINGIPLNALEFQRAILDNNRDLDILTYDDINKDEYFKWIKDYLFYLDVRLDNRMESDAVHSLMLVPLGANNPKIFQRTRTLKNYIYTNSAKAFYPTPIV